MPHAVRQPRSQMAAERQIAAWSRDPRVTVLTRPLLYRRTRPPTKPQEKGIDVRLAVDFVALALRGEYDAGVLMSHDSDLVPALEAVLELSPSTHVEVACWEPARGSTVRLRVPGRSVWCHYLTAADYAAVADTRNYARA
jgi:NYN domain